jgi:hypothetical protein
MNLRPLPQMTSRLMTEKGRTKKKKRKAKVKKDVQNLFLDRQSDLRNFRENQRQLARQRGLPVDDDDDGKEDKNELRSLEEDGKLDEMNEDTEIGEDERERQEANEDMAMINSLLPLSCPFCLAEICRDYQPHEVKKKKKPTKRIF